MLLASLHNQLHIYILFFSCLEIIYNRIQILQNVFDFPLEISKLSS
jgi:hypothetical protein